MQIVRQKSSRPPVSDSSVIATSFLPESLSASYTSAPIPLHLNTLKFWIPRLAQKTMLLSRLCLVVISLYNVDAFSAQPCSPSLNGLMPSRSMLSYIPSNKRALRCPSCRKDLHVRSLADMANDLVDVGTNLAQTTQALNHFSSLDLAQAAQIASASATVWFGRLCILVGVVTGLNSRTAENYIKSLTMMFFMIFLYSVISR